MARKNLGQPHRRTFSTESARFDRSLRCRNTSAVGGEADVPRTSPIRRASPLFYPPARLAFGLDGRRGQPEITSNAARVRSVDPAGSRLLDLGLGAVGWEERRRSWRVLRRHPALFSERRRGWMPSGVGSFFAALRSLRPATRLPHSHRAVRRAWQAHCLPRRAGSCGGDRIRAAAARPVGMPFRSAVRAGGAPSQHQRSRAPGAHHRRLTTLLAAVPSMTPITCRATAAMIRLSSSA